MAGRLKSTKDKAATLWWSFSGAVKHDKTRPRPEEKQELQDMFTGTLIEDLIAMVERAEARAQNLEMAEIEPWFASAQESAKHDSKLFGVA